MAITVEMPRDRWTLFLTGPLLGPAVLFWSMLLVVLVLVIRLRSGSWLLLGIGLTQVPTTGAALIVGAALWSSLSARRARPVQGPR